jgi:hypothetical protein
MVWRSVLGLVGGGLGLALFALVADRLGGRVPDLTHAGLGLAACLVLGLGWRWPVTRRVALPAGISLLLATVLSAAVLPGMIRAEAKRLAEGRPFCLVGPERGVAADRPRRSPYHLDPPLAQMWDLTALALARPLTLVIGLPESLPPPGPGRTGDAVFLAYGLSLRAGGFQELWPVALNEAGDVRQLDCLPLANPFLSDASGDLTVLILGRAPVPGAETTSAWGPRLREVLRLPADLAPWRGGRFGPGRLGFSAPLMPDAAPLAVEIGYPLEPAAWLRNQLRGRVRDQDAPLDFGTLPVNPLGLHAYDVPSPLVAGGIKGTYAVLAADGQPVTAIGCDPFLCHHHARSSAHRVVSVTYPVALLPRWREIEAAALARVAGLVVSDPG